MKLDQMFPKKYASGADLQGKDVSLTITQVRTERMRPHPNAKEEAKYVVYFAEATKGVILSRTLANQIDDAVNGDGDTDNWTGKRVTLYPKPMRVAGRDRIAIRARAATNGNGEPPATLQDDTGDPTTGEITAA